MVTNLWKTYSNSLFHYFNRRIGNAKIAEDLLQETFQKVWVHRNRLNRVDDHKAWLFSIARNTMIDYTRKKKEDRIDDLSIVENNVSESAANDAVEGIAQCLYELIDEYETEERDLLLDVFTKSLSQKEAARYLDIPYSTLKSRIQKAREEIVQAFNSRCCRLQYSSQGEIIGCVPVGTLSPADCS